MQTLNRSEDAWLRRLHFVERMGAVLAWEMRTAKWEMLARDKRSSVREPFERDVLQPV